MRTSKRIYHAKVGTWPAEFIIIKKPVSKLEIGARLTFRRYEDGSSLETGILTGWTQGNGVCGDGIMLIDLH